MDLTLNGILKFLHTFGYLALPIDADNKHLTGNEPAGFLGKWSAAAEEALATYQRFQGLPVTGKYDDERTLAQMCQRRCKCPDRPYAPVMQAQVMMWGKTDLRWKFIDYTLDIPQHQISDSFEKGFGVWSACTPLNFQEVLGDEQADITITFTKIDGQANVLAETYFPPVGKMRFDESESWSWKLPINRGQVDLATVVAHEAGHLIGLQHTNVQGAQMAPAYAGPKRFLEADDIRRAQQMYGSRS